MVTSNCLSKRKRATVSKIKFLEKNLYSENLMAGFLKCLLLLQQVWIKKSVEKKRNESVVNAACFAPVWERVAKVAENERSPEKISAATHVRAPKKRANRDFTSFY